MKLIKMLGFFVLLSVLFGVVPGCVMHDGASERSWTIGQSERPIARYALEAVDGQLDTSATMDPTAAVDYGIETVKRWIGLFTPVKVAEATP